MRIYLSAINKKPHPEKRIRQAPGERLEGRKTLMQQQAETLAAELR
jgi:hypothetical protein